MDRMGIDLQVLSINPFWYKKDRETAEAICRVHNESFAELCAKHPKRLAAAEPDGHTVLIHHLALAAAPIYVLYDLFTRPQDRQRGIASGLLGHIERYARDNGFVRLELSTAT